MFFLKQAAYFSGWRPPATGFAPNCRAIYPGEMPWKDISLAYSDEELGVVYAYLHNLK